MGKYITIDPLEMGNTPSLVSFAGFIIFRWDLFMSDKFLPIDAVLEYISRLL